MQNEEKTKKQKMKISLIFHLEIRWSDLVCRLAYLAGISAVNLVEFR